MANNSNRKAIEFMVVSALPPHSTNVLWMDTSIPGTPVLKIFMDGAWAGIWTTVRTEDEKSLELLTQVILEQHGLISELTDEVKAVCNATNTKVTALTSTSAKESTAQRILQAVENIDIDTSDLAKEAQVKEGKDTAVSVAKDVRSEVGTSSDTAAETGTLTAVLKWVKNKVKDIYSAITDSTNGLAAINTAVSYNVSQVSNQQGYLQSTIAKESTAQQAASDAAAAKTAAQAITGYATETNATANKNAIAALIGYTIQEIDGV